MVRPEEQPHRSSLIEPAGVSPAPTGAGASGSRPQAWSESSAARAGRQEPLRREQERGPQHQVKPAASTESQCGSRAMHVGAKARSRARWSGAVRAQGPAGVEGAARAQGSMRNRRGPSAQPVSGRSGSYKPKVKSSAVQRESEGVVVPMRAVTNNAVGGKGPCFGHARREGTCEGMAGKTGPNNPSGRKPGAKARRLQPGLRRPAKRGDWVAVVAELTGRFDTRPAAPTRFGRSAHAGSGGPSVSRVREIRKHGLNGGLTDNRSLSGLT